MEKVINNIKKLREIKSMTQVELATLSGVSVPSIKKYETGQIRLEDASLTTLNKLALALKCQVKDLFTDKKIKNTL